MRVIKSGDTHRITCTHCNSLLEIRFRDVSCSYVFGHGGYFYVVCRECRERINTPEKIFPERWKRRLDQLFIEAMGDDAD